MLLALLFMRALVVRTVTAALNMTYCFQEGVTARKCYVILPHHVCATLLI